VRRGLDLVTNHGMPDGFSAKSAEAVIIITRALSKSQEQSELRMQFP
jgi:hypothetical protein